MYNLNGLVYRMWNPSLYFLIGGIVLLVFYLTDPRQKRKRKTLIISIGAMILSVLSCGYYWLKVQNPKISSFDGTFCYYHSESRPRALNQSFTFLPFPSHPDDLKKDFYLDIPTRKEILPDGFKEGQLYRIYYEETCNVIVRIDVLASPEE